MENPLTESAATGTNSETAQPSKAASAALTEEMALALLQKRELDPELVRQIAKNSEVMKSRKVRFSLAAHPRAERRVILRLIRDFYTGELLRFALLPSLAGDLRQSAAELLLTRLPSIPLGERISLARRAPAKVAAVLLHDKEPRVWKTALENPRLTEAAIVRALQRPQVAQALVADLCRHAKWSLRLEIRAALLLNDKTSLAHALAFARALPEPRLRDILHASRLPVRVKSYLEKTLGNT